MRPPTARWACGANACHPNACDNCKNQKVSVSKQTWATRKAEEDATHVHQNNGCCTVLYAAVRSIHTRQWRRFAQHHHYHQYQSPPHPASAYEVLPCLLVPKPLRHGCPVRAITVLLQGTWYYSGQAALSHGRTIRST